jgi:hypothetical protein
MKSHYSILSVAVRPEIDEKLTIGLLAVSGNEVFFEYSKNKLATVRTLIDHPLYKYLQDVIRQIDKAVDEETAKKGTIIADEGIDIQFSESYLSYMSRYSNNLLLFSSPVQIDLSINRPLFDTLFKKYVDAVGISEKKAKPLEQVKEEFYPQVKSYYNTDIKITPQQVEGLPMAINIDVIGKNEIDTFAQIVDFDRPFYHVGKDVGDLISLMGAFEKGDAYSFLVGDEPDKQKYGQSHDTWNTLRKWNKLEYVPLKEIDRLQEYAVQHGVRPCLQSKQNNRYQLSVKKAAFFFFIEPNIVNSRGDSYILYSEKDRWLLCRGYRKFE